MWASVCLQKNNSYMTNEGKSRRKSAKVVGGSRDYWTTAAEFWQWHKQGVIVKVGDRPLTGRWVNDEARHLVTINHVVMDRRCRRYISEVLDSKKLVRTKTRRG